MGTCLSVLQKPVRHLQLASQGFLAASKSRTNYQTQYAQDCDFNPNKGGFCEACGLPEIPVVRGLGASQLSLGISPKYPWFLCGSSSAMRQLLGVFFWLGLQPLEGNEA
ncbi:MAG: hypothetical protein K8F25_18145, partial [Fimbriimonadaceae bacterium]|nr:hypothetical protein [Alphaproteobacteria bacterium]